MYRKIDKLKKLLNDSFICRPPHILLLCETWMSANSSDIRLPGYNKFECRQTHKRGGGVCIFVNELLSCRTRSDLHLDNVNFEHCLIEVKLRRHKLIVSSLYQAPNNDQVEFIKHYDQLISIPKNITNCDIVLGMDHNLDFLKNHIHSSTQQFINLNFDHDLFPVITRPTRITHTSATLIDTYSLNRNLMVKLLTK